MGQLKVNQNLVNAENAVSLVKVCPFGAISYSNEKIEISSAPESHSSLSYCSFTNSSTIHFKCINKMYFVCTHTKVIGCSQKSFKNLVT